jgi:hypothetical protein
MWRGFLRIFKTKWFARFARREGIVDSKLLAMVREIEKGLINADYGGGLIKKRVARDGGGKSGGYRSIIAYRSEEKCIFMFCFTKSDNGNLNINEVAQYKNTTGIYSGFSETEIAVALKKRELVEVTYNDKKT